MTGDGSDTTLTLSVNPVHENNVSVFFDGVYQSKSNYSISGTTLTFSTAPASGVAVEAITATNTSITTATQLSDADGDTLIQTEESSDEDKIRFDTGGTERVIIDSTGMGIGTSSPSKKLVISDGGNQGIELSPAESGVSRLFSYNRGTSAYTTLQIQGADLRFFTNASSNAERMRIDSSGNVGIGTTAVRATTHIKNAGNNWEDGLLLESNSGNKGWNFHTETSGELLIGYNSATNAALTDQSATTALTINTSGNVGIGTTSPDNKLHIYAGDSGHSWSFDSGDYFIMENNDSVVMNMVSPSTNQNLILFSDNGTRGVGLIGYNHAENSLRFHTSNTEAMRIDTDGHLLVNTTSAINTAHTFQTTHAGNNVAIFNNTVTSGNPFGVQLRYSGVGSGTGGDAYTYYTNTSGSFVLKFAVRADGDVVNANNSYGQVSDRKLKENIVDATDKLDEVKQIKIRNFNFKGDDTKQIGVVAQELETIFPALVTEKDDVDENGKELGTTTKQVKYSVLLPIAIKAIQEQQTIIEDLKARIETLEG
jgi:hypothetical protein